VPERESLQTTKTIRLHVNRFKQIDVLRALAVFLVLGRHMPRCPVETSAFLHQVTDVWARGGWIGVDIFFVLSGFLVSGLLFREHEKYRELHIGHFLIRRGFKIYPPFWLLIGVTFVGGYIRHHKLPLREVASELLFIQNYGPSLWNHTWSLAVEEHFYLLLAFGLFLLARRRSPRPFKPLPAAFVAVAVLCLGLRILGARAPFVNETHLFPTHLRIDGLLFGVLLSYLFHRHPIWILSIASRFRYVLLGAGVILLLPAFCFQLETNRFMYTYGFSLFYVGGGFLLLCALGFRGPVTPLVNLLAYIGSQSYSVYLWHMPVAMWGALVIANRFPPYYSWFIYAASYLLGAVGCGIAMSLLTEFPVLRIRDRLFPSRGASLSTNATGSNNALQATGAE
jgi:peptidoglycan/LPS O-acetylase OafA/YrhL